MLARKDEDVVADTMANSLQDGQRYIDATPYQLAIMAAVNVK